MENVLSVSLNKAIDYYRVIIMMCCVLVFQLGSLSAGLYRVVEGS